VIENGTQGGTFKKTVSEEKVREERNRKYVQAEGGMPEIRGTESKFGGSQLGELEGSRGKRREQLFGHPLPVQESGSCFYCR